MKYTHVASLLVSGVALLAAAPAAAASKPTVATLPAPIAPCDVTLTSPDALDCAGYFAGNLINGSAADLANQAEAIAELDGDFVFDPANWADVEATKILTLTGGNQLNFGTTLFGQTIIGAHFGNVAGPAGNVSVFWLFDFGTEGANFVALDDVQGFSNAVLYTTALGVPEPATWAMMLLGFGAAGYAMRRKRRPALAQLA